ncbi:FHA domain-containing protein [Fervidibacter sacchari]|uniref:FHA domain-containing protein n=1 Tax=Candidatus Fervidibacter sacchari TaxID=1448929 RepID=A0ABT2ET98_9BACT|nr:FHA domain-containing protein [Candidatus Fervidibacter sacchari]MCS3921194.1 hypothetical protein [Candidatus Fervidibacter sacchari]WKU16441.1 FHA domain-containing protein [Candidatus Fervidibacter sacchari]
MRGWLQVTLAGTFGGLIAWLVGELVFGKGLASELSLAQRFALDAGYGLITGVLLGVCLGIGHWIVARRWWQPVLAAALGAIGGLVGLLWGEFLYQLLRFSELLARPIGWALFGFVLGSSQGIARGSFVGALRAGLGGGIGAGLGGLSFALLPSLTQLPDPACRGIAWVLMGALIGSASVLVERFLAGATLKVASGKLEGKEFILDKPQLTVGRDERCDIPIYYDRNIEPRHATLEWTGAGYRIAPIGNATVIVNGQTVPVKELSHNDVIQVGNTRLVYRLRAGSSAVYLCSACYVPNRKDAKFCRNCGKPFVPLDLPKETVGQWLKQVGTALGVLLLCLSISYGLGQWIGQYSQSLTTAITPTQPSPKFVSRWQQRPLRLAVTPAGYDDIGSVLQRIGFSPENIRLWDLKDLNRLRLYDAVFVNCHRALIDFSDGQAVANYVAEGGILYASDYACSVIEAAFPRILKFGFSGIFALFGETVDAEVTDPTLMDFVGTNLRLHFDLPGWRHVERWHPSCRVSLAIKSWLSPKALLVSFPYGRGFVVYTAFHNKAQPTEIEQRLIEFLAIRPLTMRLSQQVAEEINRPVEVGTLGERKEGGLLSGRRMVMRREIVGTLSSGQSSPVYRFTLVRPSPVKIVVGWEGGDGDFSVTLWQETQPQRRWQQKANAPPLVLTVNEPLPSGNYCLQLTATKAPLPKTPFVIGVGIEQQ